VERKIGFTQKHNQEKSGRAGEEGRHKTWNGSDQRGKIWAGKKDPQGGPGGISGQKGGLVLKAVVEPPY